MNPAIGIDLGTTNSVIAHINAAGRAEVILNAEGKPITPSVVYFGENPPLVGDSAKEKQAEGDDRVASFFKRSMGDPTFVINHAGRDWTPTDLSALVLGKLKTDAETALGVPIRQAVITVPAYFNDAQRKATLAAGEQSGLEVLCIINEPTAASLAYRVHETGKTETVLVYDLGGGTFDVSLVRLAPDELTVLATDGDHALGGKDWDDRIANFLADCFAQEHGVNPLTDNLSSNEILILAERTKKTLKDRQSTKATIHHDGRSGTYELTRVRFEELTRDLMERTQRLCELVLQAKALTWSELTGVLLVGGSTRMPMVQDYVSRMSGKKPMTGVNVDEVVALGAAVMAAKTISERSGTKTFALGASRRTSDVMSHSLGMVAISADNRRYVNSIILPKNRPIPDEAVRPYQLRTSEGGTNELEVYMTQGESDVPRECSLLGKYRFQGITPTTDHVAVLDITYRYDRNGVVQIEAKERSTGKALPLTVEELPADMSWLDRAPARSGARQHLTAYLAFDLSGSMRGAPLGEAQEAAREFLRQSDLNTSTIGLISFADRVLTDQAACQNAKSLEHAIQSMHIGQVGGGNSASPFTHAHQLLRDVNGARFLIVLTDGVWSDQPNAIREAKACHEAGIEIIAIGFGGADNAFLRAIATTEKGSYFAKTGELVSTFGTIAQELMESGGDTAKKGSLRFF